MSLMGVDSRYPIGSPEPAWNGSWALSHKFTLNTAVCGLKQKKNSYTFGKILISTFCLFYLGTNPAFFSGYSWICTKNYFWWFSGVPSGMRGIQPRLISWKTNSWSIVTIFLPNVYIFNGKRLCLSDIFRNIKHGKKC